MKIRQGFVSNSSSSSFIVTFPKEMKNVRDVKESLFPDGKTFSIETTSSWNGTGTIIDSDEIAEHVWKDIQNSGDKTVFELIFLLGEDYLDGFYNDWGEPKMWRYVPYWREEGFEKEGTKLGLLDEFEGYTNLKDLEEDIKINDSIIDQDDWDKYPQGADSGLESVKEYIEKAKKIIEGDEQLYFFTWSDDSSYDAAFEHGDVFRNLPCKIESHH